MKKMPSARFPDPLGGVIRSEHPRKVGINGLVEASNFIREDGILRLRKGLERANYVNETEGSSVIGLGSFDYQQEGTTTRDVLVAVTEAEIDVFESDIGDNANNPATPTDTDWTLGGTFGPGIVNGQYWTNEPGLTVDFSNIDWTKFDADVDSVWIRLSMSFVVGGTGMVIDGFEVTDVQGTPGTAELAMDWNAVSGASTYLLQYTYFQETDDLGRAFRVDVGGLDSGIRVQVNKVWEDWYDNWKAAGGTNISDGDDGLFYYAAIFRSDSDRWGLPGQTGVVSVDRTDRPVMRAWDYEQRTHVLVASEGAFLLDVDPDPTSPTVTTCGSVGECPRAKAIGIGAQRVIAGNVSYLDVETMLSDGGLPYKGDFEDAANKDPNVNFHQFYNNETFAYWPDAVVYSGTVLTGGQKKWYPSDILRLADTPGEVVAIQEMGIQQFAVYKTDAIYTLTAQSGLSPFAPYLRASGIQGPVSPRSVVALNDSTHIYLGRDGGIYMFNGGLPQDLGDQFRTWISRELDRDNVENSFLLFDENQKQVHVFYPVKGLGGIVRKGLTIDVSKQPYTGWPILYSKQSMAYDMDEILSEDERLYDHGILCGCMHYRADQPVALGSLTVPTSEALGAMTNKERRLLLGVEHEPTESRAGVSYGSIYQVGDSLHDYGVPIVGVLESAITDLGDPDKLKVLMELEILSDPMSDVDTSQYTFPAGDNTPAISNTEAEMKLTIYGGNSVRKLKQLWQGTLDPTESPIVAKPRVKARYFSYKIEFTAPMTASPLGDYEFWGMIARFRVAGSRT